MKSSKLHLLTSLSILILLTDISTGQSTIKISGYVYDATINIPLVGANILIEGTSIGTSTDESGYFHFDNLMEGSYTLIASYVGYKNDIVEDIHINRDQPVEIVFRLSQSENKLSSIMVEAKNKSDKINIKTFSAKEIAKSNSQSVAEVLEEVPGLEIQATGGAGSVKRISLRGSNTNQVLVLLDGIPLNNQSTGNADLSKIPTNIIDRIEIYEGGSSSKFGSGAIGGAINIITKNHFRNEYKLNLSGGSYGFINFEPSFAGEFNDFSYYLSYNLTKSKNNYGYNTENTNGVKIKEERINADVNSNNIFARVNYKLDNYIFSANTQFFNSERGIPGMTKALTAFARNINNSAIFSANTKATFNNLVIDFTGSYSKNETHNSNFYPEDAPQRYKRYSRYNYKYKTDITIFNSTLYYDPFKWLNITAGYNGKVLNYNDKNFNPSLNPPENNAKDISHGLFLHQEYKINLPLPFNTLSVSPSIRYDEMRMSSRNLKRFEHQWSPSLSVYFSLGEKYQVYLKSSISRSFRVPTFSDLFYQDVRVEGKPDLLPEKSLNKEIGLGWMLNSFGKLKGAINYYNYSIEDMIVWKLGSFEVFRPFNNDAEITGQNYSISYQLPNHNISFQISYTYLQPLDKNNHQTTHNKIIPYRPQHSVKSSIHFGYKNFSAKVNYRFVGKRFVTIANTVSLPFYQVVDLTILQKINIGKLEATAIISINNLTNELYEIIRGYPIPGREFRIGIKLNY